MLKKSYDVIVVGGGAVGASTLYALSQNGISDTLLLEGKNHLGRGSTGAWGSLIRRYHLNSRTTELAMESVPYYLNFSERVGRVAGFVETGSLYFLKKHGLDLLQAKVAQMNRGPLKMELIGAQEGKKRFPSFHWYEDDVALYESYAGYACPWTTTQSWVDSACEAGAEFAVGCPVVDFMVEADKVLGVKVRGGDTFFAGTIILATGAWSNEVSEKLGITLPIEMRVIQVNHFHRQNRQTRDPFFIDPEAQAFGRPAPDGSFVGGCLEWGSEPPKGFVETMSLQEANRAKHHLSARLNWIKNASLLGGKRAVEAYTSDLNGILAFSEKYRNLLIATGWSCAGFTLAPVIGQKASQMVLGSEVSLLPVSRVSVQADPHV